MCYLDPHHETTPISIGRYIDIFLYIIETAQQLIQSLSEDLQPTRRFTTRVIGVKPQAHCDLIVCEDQDIVDIYA